MVDNLKVKVGEVFGLLGLMIVEECHRHDVMAGQGTESESRELMVGQGHELGWAGLARLDEDRGLG
jgi:hypothetical protein